MIGFYEQTNVMNLVEYNNEDFLAAFVDFDSIFLTFYG